MKIRREDLLMQLESVRPGLSLQEVHEQSSCFIFTNRKITTFNEEVSCTFATSLDIEGAVRGAPLIDLLSKMKEKTIKIHQNGKELIVTGVNRQAGIAMEKEINLPIDHIEPPKKWKKLPENFCDALGITSSCTGKNVLEHMRTCVHINRLFLEACDESQLIRYPINLDIKEPILIQGDCVKHVAEAGVVKFSIGESWAHFKNQRGLVVSCRLTREKYPNLKKFYKIKKGTRVTLPKGLKETSEKVNIFSAENVDRNLATIQLKKDRLVIKGEGQSGWFEEIKKLKYNGPPLEFTIEPKLLADVITRCNECELTNRRLRIDTGAYVYITALGIPDDD